MENNLVLYSALDDGYMFMPSVFAMFFDGSKLYVVYVETPDFNFKMSYKSILEKQTLKKIKSYDIKQLVELNPDLFDRGGIMTRTSLSSDTIKKMKWVPIDEFLTLAEEKLKYAYWGSPKPIEGLLFIRCSQKYSEYLELRFPNVTIEVNKWMRKPQFVFDNHVIQLKEAHELIRKRLNYRKINFKTVGL